MCLHAGEIKGDNADNHLKGRQLLLPQEDVTCTSYKL